MRLLQELNERAMLKKLGNKLVNWIDSKAADKLIKELDGGTPATALAVEFENLPTKGQKDLRNTIGRYLEKNEHKKLEKFYGMIGDKK